MKCFLLFSVIALAVVHGLGDSMQSLGVDTRFLSPAYSDTTLTPTSDVDVIETSGGENMFSGYLSDTMPSLGVDTRFLSPTDSATTLTPTSNVYVMETSGGENMFSGYLSDTMPSLDVDTRFLSPTDSDTTLTPTSDVYVIETSSGENMFSGYLSDAMQPLGVETRFPSPTFTPNSEISDLVCKLVPETYNTDIELVGSLDDILLELSEALAGVNDGILMGSLANTVAQLTPITGAIHNITFTSIVSNRIHNIEATVITAFSIISDSLLQPVPSLGDDTYTINFILRIVGENAATLLNSVTNTSSYHHRSPHCTAQAIVEAVTALSISAKHFINLISLVARVNANTTVTSVVEGVSGMAIILLATLLVIRATIERVCVSATAFPDNIRLILADASVAFSVAIERTDVIVADITATIRALGSSDMALLEAIRRYGDYFLAMTESFTIGAPKMLL